MEHTLALLLLIAGLVAVTAAIPQLLKLIKLKHAHEFNPLSWFIWFCYQAITVAYSLSIKAYIYAGINALWTTFYLVMVILIIKYGKRRRKHKHM